MTSDNGDSRERVNVSYVSIILEIVYVKYVRLCDWILLFSARADFERVRPAFHLSAVDQSHFKIFIQCHGSLQFEFDIVVLDYTFFVSVSWEKSPLSVHHI